MEKRAQVERHWYQDAVVYELHVKAFYDSNNDGIGDFRGLTEKLDYLTHLGVTAIWLLPFYPSPLRDDGYDIADYRNVHPSYGSIQDVRRFLAEAHRRGLRVITELVINHTSDAHPWFKRARSARAGSKWRNYYVWSETKQKYEGTRIIFCDTETSNWTWDPEAQAYYWHRFFSHQPDLNFDNPRVLDEITRAMRFWLEMGVDGLRLDAIPYLCERDGSNSENLPETHEVIKRLRAWLDANFPDRMFLAEANQWPEDVRPYFGDGDECHMAFHFPLMPRIYMALAREDRYPITDILRQTPEIPDTCQWAVFLRNHDELTLEMVSARERDYLWQFYAADPNARINLGIRRRLAPLLGGDRRKIELLTSLLLSLTGTPVLYYGDEIGMGDNIYLGDRNGVRTPMQWSSDRNGGFSKADPQQLYLPPIMDPVYGYDSVNVEMQLRQSASLLNWTRRALAARKQHCALGRGDTRLLYPRNRKILAYLRESADEAVLCVANLASSPQASELDLSEFKGRVPVEILSRSSFPPIGDLPYFITLPGYGFYSFVLARETEAPSWHEPAVTPLPEFQTLVMSAEWPAAVLAGRNAELLAGRILPEFLSLQRWYADKDTIPPTVIVVDQVPLAANRDGCVIAFIDVSREAASPQRYALPLGIAWESDTDDPLTRLQPHALARVRRGPRIGVLYDATASDELPRVMIDAVGHGIEFQTAADLRLACRPTAAFDAFRDVTGETCRRLGVEQSNTSLLVDDRVIIKLYRRLQTGIHPEIEVGRFLTDVACYTNAPRLLGSVELLGSDGTVTAVALLQEFVRNQGDGWTVTLDHLDRVLNDVDLMLLSEENYDDAVAHEGYWLSAETLARRIADLHQAFAMTVADPAFAPEPTTAQDVADWTGQISALAARAQRVLDRAVRSGALGEDARTVGEQVLDAWGTIERMGAVPAGALAGTMKTRIHGDLHLGQVVVAGTDFFVLDFEGEPLHSLERRRAKHSPLRDIAGMLRSFDYAGNAALIRRGPPAQADKRAAGERDAIDKWRTRTTTRFIAAYRRAVAGCPSVPQADQDFAAVLDAFVVEKALYEICYEAANRPDWLGIPLAGVRRLLDVEQADG